MLTTSAFLALALQCAPSIHPATLTPIVKTESAFNPYAIGVVGRVLPHQPQSMEEAVTVVKTLVNEGANFSIGLGQINRQHFDVGKPEQVFDPCTNLRMTAAVLENCYSAATSSDPNPQVALRKAISCYYSGNLKRGFQPEAEFGGTSHVQRVLANSDNPAVKVPALTSESEGSASKPPATNATPANSVQPTYESWDVLRQYPRYMPPASLPVPAPKTQETSPTTEKKTDA